MMIKKMAVTQVKLHDIIQDRWSPRAFDPAKDIAAEDLTALLEAARWAPSCFNDQPWRFIVSVKSSNTEAWQTVLSCLAEKNQRWAKNAPVLIVACAMANFNHNAQPNRWAAYDTGAASVSLCLQATALGLVAHQMGGFDAEKIRQLLNLPDDAAPQAVRAVGYQADSAVLDEDFIAMELAGRSRAPLKDRFYFGCWGGAE